MAKTFICLFGFVGATLVACCAQAATVSNGVVRVEYPDEGKAGSVRLFYLDKLRSADNWYYLASGTMQHVRHSFRSRGRVLRAEVTPLANGGKRLRLVRLTDDPDEPDLGTFEMIYELRDNEPGLWHSMTFTPKKSIQTPSVEFFVSTHKPSGQTHQFRFLERAWRVGVTPARTSAPYGRISFPIRHPWLALEDKRTGTLMALGTVPVDVKRLVFSIQFKRFELGRAGGVFTPDEPLREFAWIGFGRDVAALVKQQKVFERTVKREPRSGEARPSAPKLAQAPPRERFGVGVEKSHEGWRVSAGDFRLTVDSRTGALTQWETDKGRWLAESGGISYVLWPAHRCVGPAGRVTQAQAGPEGLRFEWATGDMAVRHHIVPYERRVVWEVVVPNRGAKNSLVEMRFSLPVGLGKERWFYWDGHSLRRVSAPTSAAEMTTLVPGGRLSQGIFPAVGLHSHKVGLAVGLEPMDIESFYGSRARPALGPLETFYYVVRLAIPPQQERRVRLVLFATDPNWSWRSVIDRYWRFWPEVFAAPKREDIWGLYAGSTAGRTHQIGDRFIDMCRRMRVGGMEFYAPFNKTGDFYPDQEPAYVRKNVSLSREDVRRAYEIANIGSCNLSYVIPRKCERKMATTTYADSVIRLEDGSFFLRDYWDVMGGRREKLAAMFAWGNSFGENLRRELRQIVKSYKPDGFYLDNGAFVWEDYSRMTEWAAFDDAGRVYTNAGIAYAKLLDDIRSFAPQVQRNPGEFIQYFSGFRGQSHLTNNVGTQMFYVRTHRLIMGRKPIFVDHPRRITRSRLYDALEFGGLPWLAGFRRDAEALVREWAPVAIALARAGWHPIPDAVADNASVRIERFGSGRSTLFTVRNLAETSISVRLRIVGQFPRLSEFRRRVLLRPRVDDKAGITTVLLKMPAEELVVLRATPPFAPSRKWPRAKFLANADPTSIVAPGEIAAQHTARRMKGFIELQAEILRKPAKVEIVQNEAQAKFPNRVLVKRASVAAIISPNPRTFVIAGPGEESMRRVLWECLEMIEAPLSTSAPKWRLAAPLSE